MLLAKTLVELLLLDAEQQSVFGDAGVGNQGVEPSVLLAHCGDGLLGRLHVCNVEPTGLGAATASGDPVHNLLRQLLTAHIADNHMRPLCGERFANSTPDAA